MEIITLNKNNQEVIVTATDQNMTIPINYMGKDYFCKWYKYNDKNNTVDPFVNFNNNSINIFCRTIEQASYPSLSQFGKNLFDFYVYELEALGYNNNFRTFKMDNKIRFINWNLSPKYSLKLSKDQNELDVNSDGSKSHFEIMTQMLRELEEEDLIRLTYKIAQKMGIGNKITNCFIVDPDTRDRYNYDYSSGKKPITAGVLGTSYKKASNSNNLSDIDSKSNCTLLFSPFIYFMPPEDQEILIIHELVHIKIGVEHQHDSYFWHMFEKYSGVSREKDWSYSKESEKYDTRAYDRNYAKNGQTNEYLINYSNNNNKIRLLK